MGGCISEPSGGEGPRHGDSLSEGTKMKTQVKGGAHMKGPSESLLRKAEEGWWKPFRASLHIRKIRGYQRQAGLLLQAEEGWWSKGLHL